MNPFIEFLIKYKFVIAFYLGIVLVIYFNRKKFEFQAKFIALKRTKLGLKLMSRWGEKYGEFIKIMGMIGIGIGFLGMLGTIYYVIWGFIKLITIPNAPGTFGLILPGIAVPGSPITLPLVHGLLALFIVVVIHEFGHGLVSRAYKIPVLSSGIVFFGPLIGAFVEPDEKKTEKKDDVVKYSIFAAGPFVNILTAVVVFFVITLLFFPVTNSMQTPAGFSFDGFDPGMPAEASGLQTGIIYNVVNGHNVTNASQLTTILQNVSVNETVHIGNSTHMYNITTTTHPHDSEKAYIGILNINHAFEVKEETPKAWYNIWFWIQELLIWIFQISLGLGAANLLPIGPVDGGRMSHLALTKMFGEKKGYKIWVRLSLIVLLLVAILLFAPMLKAIF